MADKKISQLTELTTAADDDSLVILDKDADVTKRIEVSNLVGTNELLLKTASTLTSSPQAVRSVGDEVSALQISSVGVKSSGTLTATGTSTLASATLSGDLTLGGGETVDTILDEDTMSSDDPNALCTQQSIKAYIDGKAHSDGTVTSIDVSGGTTGLTTSGGPITTSGTITLAGELIEVNGGTNQSGYTTGDILYASGTNALSKLGVGATNEVLKISGGIPVWGSVGGTGTVTSITAGNGLSGGEITSSGTLAADINNATDGTAITVATSDQVLLADADDSYAVKKINISQLPGGASGTVTSVAISGSDGIEVDSGSPITTTGTIALGLTAVDATKIADGSVTDTEFQYIGGLTSDAQTQIDAKGVGTVTSVTAAADSGSGTAITSSGTFTYTGGTGVTTSVSGTTVTIDADNNGTVTGTGTDNQLAVWDSSSGIEGSSSLTFGTSLNVTGTGGINVGATATDSTDKWTPITTTHYDTDEEKVMVAAMYSTSTLNDLYIGGGAGANNSATSLRFFTGANSTTTAGTERMVIDAGGDAKFVGNVGIGATSSTNLLELYGTGNPRAEVKSFSTTDGDNAGIEFQKSSSAVIGTLAQTVDDESLGAVTARGVTSGPASRISSGIYFEQDAAAGASWVPGRMVFKTAVNATGGAEVEALRLDSSQDATFAGRVTATKATNAEVTALTDGATITPDFDDADNYSVTLAGNRTLANPSSTLIPGQSGVITITQDGSGSQTLAYGDKWMFEGGTAPTLSTAASAVDLLVYYVESTARITAKLIPDTK